MATDAFSVDLTSLINDSSLERMSNDAEDPVGSQKGGECLKGLSPFWSSSTQNIAACHPDEGIWDKFEFPDDTESGRNEIINLADVTETFEKGVENDGDAEEREELTVAVSPSDILMKEDVMWSPRDTEVFMIPDAHVEHDPLEDISDEEIAAEETSQEELSDEEMVDTPNDLFPCVSPMKAGRKYSLSKIKQQKRIVGSSSAGLQSLTVNKNVSRGKCVMTSPNALHAVTSNNSLLLKKYSNTELTSPRRTYPDGLLNIEQPENFAKTTELLSVANIETRTLVEVTPSPTSFYDFIPETNMLPGNCSNTVIGRSPTKTELKYEFLARKQQQLNRTSTGCPKSTPAKKTHAAKVETPSQREVTKSDNGNPTFWLNMPSTSSVSQKSTYYNCNDGSKSNKDMALPITAHACTQSQSQLIERDRNDAFEVKKLASNVFCVSRKIHASSSSYRNTHPSMESPVAGCSRWENKGACGGKQHSSVNSDGQIDLDVKRHMRRKYAQKHRLKISNLVQQLRSAVPSTEHNSRASVALVLQEAINYCRRAAQVIENQKEETRKLRSQQNKLRKKLEILRFERAVGRLQHSIDAAFGSH